MPYKETVVISQFRNVLQWVESMRERPHYSPQHYNIEKKKNLDWETFVTQPWTMNRDKKDLNLRRDSFLNGTINST